MYEAIKQMIQVFIILTGWIWSLSMVTIAYYNRMEPPNTALSIVGAIIILYLGGQALKALRN